VNKYNSKLTPVANALLSISPRSKEMQGKVNLLSWPQAAFQHKSTIDTELEAARTQYAIAAITELLNKNGAQVLPRIMNELNYRGNPDTDTICVAIKKITGVDFKNVLLSYVPDNVRSGIVSGEEKKLTAKAESLTQNKKWSKAATTLRAALEMAPDDVNARLNLAWIEREINEQQDAELQVFLSAALLKQQKYSIHLYTYATEGYYVMARLGIMRGDLKFAKELLTTVLQINPDHKDAKRAMDEIKKMEGAVKG
jgi:tetratricopeptide (TPR) repeat protein